MSESTGDVQDDLSSLFGNYYDGAWKPDKGISAGEIVFLPVPESRRRHWIGEVTRADGRSHTNATIKIREQIADDFKGKNNRLPIAALSLDSSHEIVVSRAKLRPAVVIASTVAVNCESLPEGPQRNKALNGLCQRFIVAPIYSVSRPNAAKTFGPVMTARVRGMMYSEFFYLPRSGSILTWPGVVRLDHVLHSELIDCERTSLKLADRILAVLLEQFRLMIGGEASNEFKELRELLVACIPANCLGQPTATNSP